MSDFKKVSKCKLCLSTNLKRVISFPKLPIGDLYLPKEKSNFNKKVYELDIMMCQNCHHYQNSGFVNPKLIYEYYLSRPAATNINLEISFQEYARHLIKNFSRNKKRLFAIEAGSNAGTFIDYMKKNLNIKVLGIEPSNLAEESKKKGLEIINDYFNKDLAKKILLKYGRADFFIANHTFSNIIDNTDFVEGVKLLLKNDGVFSMQTHYHKAVIEKNLIENFTHEHLSGFWVKPLKNFFEKNGMEIIDVKIVEAKSGSIRCFIQKKNGPHKVSPSVQKIINDEIKFGMLNIDRHKTVEKFILERKNQIHNYLSPIIKNKGKIAGYGTSIGATTFSFNYNLGKHLSFLIDDDDYRQNLLSPHYHIPVISPKKIREKNPSAIIILAPLYANDIIKKNLDYLSNGGVFIKVWPKFEIVKNEFV